MRNGRQLITLTGRPDAFGARDKRGHQRIALPFSRAAIRAMSPRVLSSSSFCSSMARRSVRRAAGVGFAIALGLGWGSAVARLSARAKAAGRLSDVRAGAVVARSEEHTSELQSLMRISYAVFCLKKKKH